ncbi:MAG: glycosyltransferase [Phycisphaerae bacterium]|nr:glycosyltransferase [Phycisphaerae bacterium]
MSLDALLHVALIGYLTVLSLLCVYGLHRCLLVTLFYRVRRHAPQPKVRFSDLPPITIQLPMYNEQYVAQRIIEQTCRVDYPRDRLQIQVLDDSTDETSRIASETVQRMRAAGHDVVYLHRDDRTGYKAGALEAGLKSATGDFVAIFDADFLPPENILLDTIHHFTDESVGMVQCRWEHLNRETSLLTQAQAILLDGHFVVEHTARNRTGRYMSFNGTAGIWRKAAIRDAGGWEHDTLTEDLDLSYRAQLRDWRFVFRTDLASPAELPPEINAFKAQQHRWTKGGAQTCVKLLPKVLRSNCPLRVKVEAFFHLTSWVVYILMVLLSLLIGPALYARIVLPGEVPHWQWLIEMLLFFVGTGSALSFYICSQRELLRSWYDSVRFIPALMAIGIGIALNNAVAAIEGILGHQSEFVRTPKFGDAAQSRRRGWRKRLHGFRGRGMWQGWVELGLGFYLIGFFLLFMQHEQWYDRTFGALPFLALFVGGYLYVGILTLTPRLFTPHTPTLTPA